MRSWQAPAVVFVTAAALAAAPQPHDPKASPPPGLAKGDVVPPFDAEAVDGATVRVAYPKGSATVLLFFMSSCPTCHRMIPAWNRAFERRPRGLNVYAVMLDQEVPGFFESNPIAFPVLRAGRTPKERNELAQLFKVRNVPLTLRVGAGGKVEDVGPGVLDPIRLGDFFQP